MNISFVKTSSLFSQIALGAYNLSRAICSPATSHVQVNARDRTGLSRDPFLVNLRFKSTPETGLEPATSALGVRRSIQTELPGHENTKKLAYKRFMKFVAFSKYCRKDLP